ncbi:MAG: ankyrin repeat domain-containing protein [Candidatus Babeliales bacterium]
MERNVFLAVFLYLLCIGTCNIDLDAAFKSDDKSETYSEVKSVNSLSDDDTPQQEITPKLRIEFFFLQLHVLLGIPTLSDITKDNIAEDLTNTYLSTPSLSMATVVDSRKRSPLHYTVENCLYKSSNLLIKRGINIDMQDENGCTALHLLAQKPLPKNFVFNNRTLEETEEIGTLLIDAQPEPIKQEPNNLVPHKIIPYKKLHIYAIKNHLRKINIDPIKIGNLLLQNGANIYIKDKNGKRALDYAKENGNHKLANSIMERQAKEESEMTEIDEMFPPSSSPLSSLNEPQDSSLPDITYE